MRKNCVKRCVCCSRNEFSDGANASRVNPDSVGTQTDLRATREDCRGRGRGDLVV
jgi:hypothetical protein